MSNRENILNIIFIFMAMGALGVILGLSVLRTVDKRLSEVNINLPEIKIPKTMVNIECPHDNNQNAPFYQELRNNYNLERMTGGNNLSGVIIPPTKSEPAVVPVPTEKSSSDSSNGKKSNQRNKSNRRNKSNQRNKSNLIYNQLEQNIKNDNQAFEFSEKKRLNKTSMVQPNKGHSSDIAGLSPVERQLVDPGRKLWSESDSEQMLQSSPDFNRIREEQNNRNYYLGSQQLESQKVSNFRPVHPTDSHYQIDHYRANQDYLGRSSGLSHQYIHGNYYDQPNQSSQYYKDLNQMSERQILKFKNTAKFDKMSLKDYLNWLSLFVKEPESLSPENQYNLRRWMNGDKITERDIPKQENTVKTAKEYYQEMYDENY